MPAGRTYESIATTTLGSASAITFNSFPSTYTDLIIVITGRNSSAGTGNTYVRFNGDSTLNNYFAQRILSDGTGISGEPQDSNYIMIGDLNSSMNSIYLHIFGYANTVGYKGVLSHSGNATNYMGGYSGTWFSTAAITSITITGPSTFQTDTVATLYGITAA
jgi:hypothetical protein